MSHQVDWEWTKAAETSDHRLVMGRRENPVMIMLRFEHQIWNNHVEYESYYIYLNWWVRFLKH